MNCFNCAGSVWFKGIENLISRSYYFCWMIFACWFILSHALLYRIVQTKFFVTLFLHIPGYRHEFLRKCHEKEFVSEWISVQPRYCKKCCELIIYVILYVISTYCCMFHILNLCTSSCNTRDLLSLNFHKLIFIVLGAIRMIFTCFL